MYIERDICVYMYICSWVEGGPSHQSGCPRATKRTAARPAWAAADLMRAKSELSTRRRSEILIQRYVYMYACARARVRACVRVLETSL